MMARHGSVCESAKASRPKSRGFCSSNEAFGVGLRVVERTDACRIRLEAFQSPKMFRHLQFTKNMLTNRISLALNPDEEIPSNCPDLKLCPHRHCHYLHI